VNTKHIDIQPYSPNTTLVAERNPRHIQPYLATN